MPSYTIKSISKRANWFLFHLPNLNERHCLKASWKQPSLWCARTFGWLVAVLCRSKIQQYSQVLFMSNENVSQFSTNSLGLQKKPSLYWTAWSVYFQGCTEAEPLVQAEKDPAAYAADPGALHLPHQLQQHPPAVPSTRSTMPAQGQLKGQGEPWHGQG